MTKSTAKFCQNLKQNFSVKMKYFFKAPNVDLNLILYLTIFLNTKIWSSISGFGWDGSAFN